MSHDKKLKYDDLVEEITIETLEELKYYKNFYSGKSESSLDIRDDYIFRGIGDKKFELIPKSLRTDNDKYIISDYLNSKLFLNKYYSPIFDDMDFDDSETNFEIQYKRELFVLFNFLDWADKSGLKIPFSTNIRKLLHSHIDNRLDYWPKSSYFEVISLAQHFKLPTCALDWSYNYKVAAYFAVENILRDNESDCVIWAFNYRPFEMFSSHQLSKEVKTKNKPQLRFYRPKYYNNPNIKAQKGLFTMIINNEHSFNEKPLDRLIFDEINDEKDKNFEINENGEITLNLHGIPKYTFKKNEKVFYKFVISGKLKPLILKELYKDGYSEEFLFPGYHGVVRAMEHRIKLEKYCKKNQAKDKVEKS